MRYFLFFILVFGILSCAPSRFVEPLDKGQHAVAFDVGGPLIEYGGAIIPTPISTISYGYGLDSNKTIYGGFHTTSLLFGNFQIDGGATFKLIDQSGIQPNFSISPAFTFVTRPGEDATNFWPHLDLNAYWNYGKRKNYFYLGATNWFEPQAKRAHEETTLKRFLFNPQVGHTVKLGNWQLQTELKFLGISESNAFVFVPYKSLLGSRGATGVYINLIKTFGK
jgi:hypothetical protein